MGNFKEIPDCRPPGDRQYFSLPFGRMQTMINHSHSHYVHPLAFIISILIEPGRFASGIVAKWENCTVSAEPDGTPPLGRKSEEVLVLSYAKTYDLTVPESSPRRKGIGKSNRQIDQLPDQPMTGNALQSIKQIESSHWEAADPLHANSRLAYFSSRL